MKKITHTVAFKLKWDKDSAEESTFIQKSIALLAALPNVQNFKAHRQFSPKNPYDFEFTMDFMGQEEYDGYSNHPVHVKYVKEIWLNEVSEFLEKDTVEY